MKILKVYLWALVLVMIVFVSISCRTIAGQPQILRTNVSPKEIKPGDKVVIEAVVKDRHHVVRRVECSVKEDPRLRLQLNDDGAEPDKKANDGIWTLLVMVPEDAPKGKFTLEITAYRKDGLPVSVRTKGGEVKVLKDSLLVEIK